MAAALLVASPRRRRALRRPATRRPEPTGAIQGINRIVVKLDDRLVAALRGGRAVLNVRLRGRNGRRPAIEAPASDGRALASATTRTRAVRSGKHGVGVGGTARPA